MQNSQIFFSHVLFFLGVLFVSVAGLPLARTESVPVRLRLIPFLFYLSILSRTEKNRGRVGRLRLTKTATDTAPRGAALSGGQH